MTDTASRWADDPVLCLRCAALVTPELKGACASVGIEHGRTWREEMALYLAAIHEKEHQ